MSITKWTPKPGDPCPPLRYTQVGPHAFADEDELARRRARWHAMTNAPPPPEEDEAPEAATAGASEGTDENTTSEPDAAPPAVGYAHRPTQPGLSPLDWAFEQDAGGPGPKLVLVVLAKHCGKDRDRCWPAVSTIGALASMGRTAVGDNLRRLEALGLIHDTGERRGATRQVVVWQLGNVPESEHLKGPESEQVEGVKGPDSGGKGAGFRLSPVRIPDTEPSRNLQGRFREGSAADADGGLAPAAAAAPVVYPSIGSAALWVKLHTSRKRTAAQGDFDAWGEQAQAAQADGCDVNAGIQLLIEKRHFRDFPRVGGPQSFTSRVSRPRRKTAPAFPKNTRKLDYS